MANIKTIEVTVQHESEIIVSDTITKDDFDAYLLRVTLGGLQSISGEATIRFLKPDGSWADRGADIKGTTVEHLMMPDLYDQAGTLSGYVRLLDNGAVFTPLLIRFTGVRVPRLKAPLE